MLTYQLRERNYRPKNGSRFEFPNDVTVEYKLLPAVQFGGEVGPTRNAVFGSVVELAFDLSRGRAFSTPLQPLFDPITVTSKAFGAQFEMTGNAVRATKRCGTFDELNGFVSALYYAFPAILNVYLPDVSMPQILSGQVGSVGFEWLYEPSQVIVDVVGTSKEHQESLIRACWERLRFVRYYTAPTPSRRASLFLRRMSFVSSRYK